MPRVREIINEDYDECQELLQNIQNGRISQSNCCALILKVNEWLKKPCIEHDLSGVLDNYLRALQSSRITIHNGVFTVNFAEAALLLQASAQLFGKKVDMLYDFVIEYLNRNMCYEEKTDDNKEIFDKLEERKKKYKRKTKAIIEPPSDEAKISQLVSFNVDKSGISVQGLNFADFQQFTRIEEKSKEDKTIYECDQYAGSYQVNWEDRWVNNKERILEGKVRHGDTSTLDEETQHGLLTHLGSITHNDTIQNVAHDLLEQNMYGEKEPLGDYGSSSIVDRVNRELNAHHRQVHTFNIPDQQVERGDVQDYMVHKWLTEQNSTVEKIYNKWDAFQADCKAYEDSMYTLKAKDDEVMQYLGSPSQETSTTQGPDAFDSLLSTSFSLCLSSVNSTHSAEDLEVEHEVTEISEMIGKRSDPNRKTLDSDLDSGMFSTTLSISRVPSINGLSVGEHESMHLEGFEDCEASFKSCSRAGTPTIAENVLKKCIVEKVVLKQCKRQRKKLTKEAMLGLDDWGEYWEDKSLKKPKRIRKVKERLLPVTTASLKDFNRFFCQNYNAADNEGDLDPIEEDDDDDLLLDLIDCDTFSQLELLTSTPKNRGSRAPVNELITDTNNNNENEELVPEQQPCTSFADLMGQDAGIRLKHVLEWKKFIVEKIGNRTVSDFDMHEEETEVIEFIGEINNTVKYKDMCKGKTSALITRNFSALLHLATNNNVSLLDIEQGALSNDGLKVKLLSTDRHHEHLDEYNTPKKVDYKRRDSGFSSNASIKKRRLS